MLEPIDQPVVWNFRAHFPTETKLKWQLAPRLAQRSQTRLIAMQPPTTLHTTVFTHCQCLLLARLPRELWKL